MENTPNIRFKGFTEPWEQRKLGDISASYSGGTPTAGKAEFYGGDIPFIRSGEISSDKTELFLTELGYENSSAAMVNEGDILYALYGATSGEVSRSKLKGAINQAILAIQPNNQIDAEFLMQWLRKSKEQIVTTYLQGGQGNLSGAIIKALDVDTTSCREQKEIGLFFRNLDHLIIFHQRKCDEMSELKKFMLQKMFPKNGEQFPEIRFSGFNEPWEPRKFGDVAKRQSETIVSDKENPCVEYEDVISERGALNKDIYLKDVNKSGIKFSEEDILYGKLRPYLHNWLNPDFTGVAVGDWWVLRHINADKDFLYRLIQTSQFDAAANQSSGTKMPRADWELISNTEFQVPFSIDEQSQIASVFDNFDVLITLHQRKCDELKEFKKYMLQNMFPKKG